MYCHNLTWAHMLPGSGIDVHCNPLYKGEAQEQHLGQGLPVRQLAGSPVAKAAESWHRRLAGTSPARYARALSQQHTI